MPDPRTDHTATLDPDKVARNKKSAKDMAALEEGLELSRNATTIAAGIAPMFAGVASSGPSGDFEAEMTDIIARRSVLIAEQIQARAFRSVAALDARDSVDDLAPRLDAEGNQVCTGQEVAP